MTSFYAQRPGQKPPPILSYIYALIQHSPAHAATDFAPPGDRVWDGFADWHLFDAVASTEPRRLGRRWIKCATYSGISPCCADVSPPPNDGCAVGRWVPATALGARITGRCCRRLLTHSLGVLSEVSAAEDASSTTLGLEKNLPE